MKSKRIFIEIIILLIVGIICIIYSNSFKLDNENKFSIQKSESTEEKIERLISAIVDSPKEASSPEVYIEEHKAEYDELVEMDTQALEVLFKRLEKNNQDLESWIELSVCRKILNGEDIKIAANTPYEWYEAYKSHVVEIYELNSREFMEKNCKKSCILLDMLELY